MFFALQPHAGRAQPYLEMLIGANVFFTVTHLDDNFEGGVSSTNYDDTALSLGPGGGMMMRLWGAERTPGSRSV